MKTVVLSICLALSTGAAIYFYSSSDNNAFLKNENDKLTSKAISLEKEIDDLTSKNKKAELEIEQLQKEVSSLKDLMKKVKEVKAEAQTAVKTEKTKTAEVPEEKPVMSKMEEERRAQMKKFLSKEIDKNYTEIFDKMGLSDAEIASIKEKLLDRDSEIVSAIFKSILQSLPTEEGQTQEQALAKSILDSIEKTNAELSLEMGSTFNEFREMEQRGFTLRELSKFEGMLSEGSLGDTQRLGLNDLMFEHHNSVLQDVAAGESTFKEADQKLVDKSGQYLNKDQQKSLETYLKMKRGGN